MSRVWRLLPPRRQAGARSSSSTESTRWRAEIAATRPALPPPTTTTAYVFKRFSGARGDGRRQIAGKLLHDLVGLLANHRLTKLAQFAHHVGVGADL